MPRLSRCAPGLRQKELCWERLEKLIRVLWQTDGWSTLRKLNRKHHLQRWEIEAAQQAGWVRLDRYIKPQGTKPTICVSVTQNLEQAIEPPLDRQLPRLIAPPHRRFAELTLNVVDDPRFGDPTQRDRNRLLPWKMLTQAEAYRTVYPNANDASARTSASALVKHPDVQAVRAWIKAQCRSEIAHDEPMPETAQAIWDRLAEVEH